jgi:hypothetical protein
MPGSIAESPAPVKLMIVLAAVMLMSFAASANAAPKDSPGVQIENLSEPVLCAEKDNVTLTFSSPGVTQFRIEAVHPAYINALQRDSYEPDWTACEFAAEALAQPPPRKVTLYEGIDVWLTGYTFPNFWRDRKVPVRVGDKVNEEFHLIQLWVRRNERSEEVLVLYPTDGYWRARPLPPKHLGWSSYGSSFLVGPVEHDGRPIVNITEVIFDPETLTFTLKFERGGQAQLKITKLDNEAQVIDVAFDKPVTERPFAALRSMYVTRFNNDAADVAVLEKDAKAWREEPVMAFTGAETATSLWLGRNAFSRHNTSAPDMVFKAFSDGTIRARNWGKSAARAADGRAAE